jgi:hypothetical protein
MTLIFPTTFDANLVTELCRIMGDYGSDKGNRTNSGWHNYTTFYHALFSPIRNNTLRIFELGLGTNNVSLPSNMGASGKPGASLRGWKDYFPNATVVGADIDKDILFTEDRISTYYCDQLSPDTIHAMWKEPSAVEPFDIIIEDGLHTFEANKCFFENAIHKVKSGGVYIIEDIVMSEVSRYEAQINEWSRVYPTIKFHIVAIPHRHNRHDNCVIVAFVN